MNNSNEFRVRAEEVGADEIYEDGSQEFSMSEDDGSFFVEQFGLRAAWFFGQEISRRDFNREANQVLREMGRSEKYNQKGLV